MGTSQSHEEDPSREGEKHSSSSDEDDLEKEKEEDSADDEDDLKAGFHVIFSPELVRRLQGDSSAEDEEELEEYVDPHSVNEKAAIEEQRRRESDDKARVAALISLSRQEESAIREIEQTLQKAGKLEHTTSATISALHKCSAEKDACVACMDNAESPLECQEVIQAYENCVQR